MTAAGRRLWRAFLRRVVRGNQWMPFLRAGAAKGTAALYDRSLSAGIGYYGRNTDLAGLGLNWAEARGIDGDQFTLEAFYRFSISARPADHAVGAVHLEPTAEPRPGQRGPVRPRTRLVF